MLGEPAFIARHRRGDAQREALLAEQRVAAVSRADTPDFTTLGEVQDEATLGREVAERVQPLDERRALAGALELLQGDALQTPFESGSFGLITCFGAFGHILQEDEPRFCREVARLLEPGGRFVFITTERPPVWAPELWVARGFNAVMRVRNALIKPEFIMYYLTFLLPGARWLCEGVGLDVEVKSGLFPRPFKAAKLVIATKPR